MNINLSSQFKKFLRVWKVLKKPSKEEFWMVTKISALGILAIGVIGFLLSIGVQILLPSA